MNRIKLLNLVRFVVALFLCCGVVVAAEPDRFEIRDVTPADNVEGVSPHTAVQLHVGKRFDPATITEDAVRLWAGKSRVAARVTSDLGGVLTISPSSPLKPNADYRVEVTAAVKSLDGEALPPFTSRFRTGSRTAPAARTLPPMQSTKIGEAQGITSLALGPDGALYAATWKGRLLRWRLDAETGRAIGEPYTIWKPGQTRITALCFDPDAINNRRLWVALDDNASESVCELRFSARIIRLTLPTVDGETPEVSDVITGLPVGDHAVSGLTFGPDGRLYFFCGAITMLGADKSDKRETPLSAAVLSADVRSSDFAPVNVNTEAPTRYDPQAADAPVTLYATGIREAYDLAWHRNGRLYAGVNQNDTAERTPENKSRKLSAVNARPDEPLIRIEAGRYYGQPNPSRDEWVLLGGNPTAGIDPWEVPQLPVGTRPEPRFDPELLTFNLVGVGGQSADGCIEYRGTGPLDGRLLVCFYTSARTIHTFAFSADGTRVVAEEPLCNAKGDPLKFGGPLDLVVDERHERIYVADFSDSRRNDSAGRGTLWLVEPAARMP